MILAQEQADIRESLGQVRIALASLMGRVQAIERQFGARVVSAEQHALDVQARHYIGSCDGLPFTLTATPWPIFEGVDDA